jgi:hypothetical protein
MYVYVYVYVCGGADHNQYIHRNYIWQSNYCAGLRVLNITDDMKLTEVKPVLTVYSLTHWLIYMCTHSLTHSLTQVGSFDVSTHCSASNQWLGSWSNFPFFASGNIAVTSIELGLFILKVSE